MSSFFSSMLIELSHKNLWKVAVGTLILKLMLSLVFANFLFSDYSNGYPFESPKEEFFITVVIAPLIETILFQYLIIDSILRKRSDAFLLASFCSAICFGLAHHYSAPYMLLTFLGGFLLAILYLTAKLKGKSPFLVICLTHALYNLIGFTLNHL